MLDDHDAQALAALASGWIAFVVVHRLLPALTVEFAAVVAVGAAIVGWVLASEWKRSRRGHYYSMFDSWQRRNLPVRLGVVVLLAGLSVFAVSATWGTGISAIDKEVAERTAVQESELEGEPAPDTEILKSDNEWVGEDDILQGEVTIYVDDQAGGGEDFERLVKESIKYWNTEGSEYVERDLVFEYVEGDNGDIPVRYVDHVYCQGPKPIGCAPQTISGDGHLTSAEAEVEAGWPPDVTVRTITHELGHILGLDHGDEPQEVMSTEYRGSDWR